MLRPLLAASSLVLIATVLGGCGEKDHSPAALCAHLEAEVPSRADEHDTCLADKQALESQLSPEAYRTYAECWLNASTELDFFACAQEAAP